MRSSDTALLIHISVCFSSSFPLSCLKNKPRGAPGSLPSCFTPFLVSAGTRDSVMETGVSDEHVQVKILNEAF